MRAEERDVLRAVEFGRHHTTIGLLSDINAFVDAVVFHSLYVIRLHTASIHTACVPQYNVRVRVLCFIRDVVVAVFASGTRGCFVLWVGGLSVVGTFQLSIPFPPLTAF